MKKYVLKETGKEVFLGDTLVKIIKTFKGKLALPIVITESTLAKLVKEGVIEEVNPTQPKSDISEEIGFYIEHLANRAGWKAENLAKYLDNLALISEAALFSILLREIAIVLDKQYPDHIENSPEIFVISLANGEIQKVKELHRIKNFKNFAAFRTVADAIKAKSILKPFMVDMFKKNGK